MESLLLAAQFVLGLGVGAQYVGVTLGELKRDVLSGIGYCVLLSAIAPGFAEIVIAIGAAPPMEAFLAFAPADRPRWRSWPSSPGRISPTW